MIVKGTSIKLETWEEAQAISYALFEFNQFSGLHLQETELFEKMITDIMHRLLLNSNDNLSNPIS